MTNLAQEARQKAQDKWPGAAVHGRGRRWIEHQHPTDPARFMLDTHIGPIHFGPADDQEIDTAWQPTTGAWQYEMTLNSFQTYARDTFNVGDIFQFEKDGETLMFDPQSINWIDENTSRQQIAIKQPIAAVVSDDILSFPQAYGPGRHFQYQNQTARLQKLLTIDNASDLPAPTVQGNDIWFEAEFSMSLSSGINFWIDGVLWTPTNNVRVQTANLIEIRDDATGTQVLWWLGYPRAWDSSGENETTGQLEVRRQGGPSSLFITVRIPKTWIDTAQFPIFIDPTIDAQVAASADDSFERGTTGLNVITDTTLLINNNEEMGAQRFVVNIANGATVNDAYLDLYVPSTSSDSLNHYVSCEDADTAAVYTTGNYNIGSRSYTSSPTAWSGSNIGSGWTESSTTPCPDISAHVEAVLGRGGWSSGNYMGVLVDLTTNVSGFGYTAYDGSSTNAPKLHIDYTAGGATYPIPEALHAYRQRRL